MVDFDVAGHWRAYLAEFDDRRHRTGAVLRLSGRRAVADAPPRAGGGPGRPEHREPGPGRVDARHRAGRVARLAVRELLRLGPDVEVIAPDRLRARIAEALRATIGRYGPDV